ncbi:MAG: SpoIIE family protein phosphatase [Heliobacteriaceae bacterium]|jgi:serine/threonine protein phosphatase PrpC|nr:SpoIIE family protein phosphatase [Heliobacteriaceae bacterium]
MFIDIDCAQQKKYNQNAYGDCFLSKRTQGRLIAVLSDGLGSGIKANILSCMTAAMLLKFLEAGSNIQKACEIIMNSLPVCQVRKISYSTFSAIDCSSDGTARIVEEGNPQFIRIRNGEVLEPECKIIASTTFPDRCMRIYNIKLEPGDRLIFCSDGVTQSGLGVLKLGLRREGLIDLIMNKLKTKPDISSRSLSKYIVRCAQYTEADKKAKDDISAVSIYCREPRESLIFTGPPFHAENDKIYADLFKNFSGKKAICGGATANILSRELNIPIENQIPLSSDNLPFVSQMEGVNLVTEGILTLTRACEYLDAPEPVINDNAAGQLVKFFLESDCINFMVGAKLNQAHYDPGLPVEIEIRKNIIKKISKLLEEKYIKKVTVQYI